MSEQKSNRNQLPLEVRAVEREPGRYFVESRRFVCMNLRRRTCRFTCLPRRAVKLKFRCPRCGSELAKAEPYLCDVNLYGGIGKCGCDNWEARLGPTIKRLAPALWPAARLGENIRCKHLRAAMLVHALLEIDARAARCRTDPEMEGE